MHSHIALVAHHDIVVGLLVKEIIEADITIYVFIVIVFLNIYSRCPGIAGKLSCFFLRHSYRLQSIDHFHVLDWVGGLLGRLFYLFGHGSSSSPGWEFIFNLLIHWGVF